MHIPLSRSWNEQRAFVFSEVAEIALVAARLGQFQQLLKTRVILTESLILLGPMRLPIQIQ